MSPHDGAIKITAEDIITSKRNFIIIIVAVAAALVIAAVSFTAVGLGGFDATTGLLETAMRYFSELDYEQAIIQFEKVLSIEPTNIEAYRPQPALRA